MSAGEQPGVGKLPLGQALALGLLHGPSELLPVSSSAHTTLVPWLLGWPYHELDPRLRKSFEVALHAGTAAGLLISPPWRSMDGRHGEMRGRRGEMGGRHGEMRGRRGDADRLARPRALVLACASAPPALAGYALGERIERRFGTPATIAVGLLAGAGAMVAGELHGGGRLRGSGGGQPRNGKVPRGTERAAGEADVRDGLALGAAQALALMPGVSRSGMATAAARSRGFASVHADRLCWQAGLPVIAGATLLQSARLAQRGVRAEHRRALAAGAAAALLSTHLCGRLLSAPARMRLLPATIGYRAALAGVVIRRVRDNTRGRTATANY